MQTQWIIEHVTQDPSYKELADAVKKQGLPLLEIHGDLSKEQKERLFSLEGSLVFNGTIDTSTLVKRYATKCHPVSYCNLRKYKCSKYYPYFASKLFNGQCIWTTLEQLYHDRFFYYGAVGRDAKLFIRPDSGEKLFQAQLLDIIDLDRFYEQCQDIKDKLILISRPKNINWEGRIVCSTKEIIAHSTYRYQGQISKIPAIPKGAKELALQLLEIPYYPDSVFCYDLCEDNDGSFWLLELTSFSSAGLYACDKNAIVEKVSKIALEDYYRETFDVNT